jgi:hypothetical protein
VATVRNISPDRRRVPLLGRDVDSDEVVEVPDELAWGYAWPAEDWAVEAPDPPVASEDTQTAAQPESAEKQEE